MVVFDHERERKEESTMDEVVSDAESFQSDSEVR